MTKHERVIDLDGPGDEEQVVDAIGTYTMDVACSNCEWEGEANIPKGTKVNDAACPQCGCVELFKPKGEDETDESPAFQPASGDPSDLIRILQEQQRNNPPATQPMVPEPLVPAINPHPMIPWEDDMQRYLSPPPAPADGIYMSSKGPVKRIEEQPSLFQAVNVQGDHSALAAQQARVVSAPSDPSVMNGMSVTPSGCPLAGNAGAVAQGVAGNSSTTLIRQPPQTGTNPFR